MNLLNLAEESQEQMLILPRAERVWDLIAEKQTQPTAAGLNQGK